MRRFEKTKNKSVSERQRAPLDMLAHLKMVEVGWVSVWLVS